MVGIFRASKMALSPGQMTSRFSNWSQHLDLSLFKPFTKRPTHKGQAFGLGVIQEDDFSWEAAKENPVNWPKTRKGIHTIIPLLQALISSLAATIITPAIRDFGRDFHVNPFISNLPYALYIFGLAIGSFLGPVVIEGLSRKNAMLLSLAVLALFQMGVGLANDIIIIFCLRFTAGLGGGIGLVTGASILFDMYSRQHRIIPYIVQFGAFLSGPVAGPVLGTYVAKVLSRDWPEFGIAIITGPVILLTLLMRDTCHWRIARAKDLLLDQVTIEQAFIDFLRVLVRNMSTLCLGLWIGVIMGVQYSFYSALPEQLRDAYRLDWLPRNLIFLALGLGSVFGLAVHFIIHSQILSALANLASAKRLSNYSDDPAPSVSARYHLFGALPVTILLPMVTILFIFTILPGSSIFISLVLLVLMSTCSSVAFLSGLSYLVEVFNTTSEAIVLAGYFFVIHIGAGAIVIASAGCMGPLGFKSSFGIFTAAMALLGSTVWGLWIWHKKTGK